jgi:hypothetical protein
MKKGGGQGGMLQKKNPASREKGRKDYEVG